MIKKGALWVEAGFALLGALGCSSAHAARGSMGGGIDPDARRHLKVCIGKIAKDVDLYRTATFGKFKSLSAYFVGDNSSELVNDRVPNNRLISGLIANAIAAVADGQLVEASECVLGAPRRFQCVTGRHYVPHSYGIGNIALSKFFKVTPRNRKLRDDRQFAFQARQEGNRSYLDSISGFIARGRVTF